MPRAQRHVRDAEAWWSIHRGAAPGAIEDELRGALRILRRHPEIGSAVTSTAVRSVRRLLLRGTRYAVFYRVSERARRVDVLAFWHASRGAGPPL